MSEISLFWDLPNLAILVFFSLIMILGTGFYRDHPSLSGLVMASTLLPFLTNYVLFDPYYMPDQFKYLRYAKEARNLEFTETWLRNVPLASYIMALVPVPVIETVRSLGIVNKILYFALFFFLYRTGRFSPAALAFYLLYPSLQLYSSLALRDTLVFLFMMFGAYFFMSRKMMLALIIILPLAFLKYQNFLIMLVFFANMFFYSRSKDGFNLSKFISLASLPIALIILAPWAIPIINIHRRDMWVEDGGFVEDVIYLQGLPDLVLQICTGWFQFLLRPFPWEATNLLQFVQSFENVVVAVALLVISTKEIKRDANRAIVWVFFLVLSLGIYSLVVANFGTAARYKFGFIAIFALGISYTGPVRGRVRQ